MKKLILLTFFLSITIIGQSQVTKRVLVEKFTSAGCGNCPNGTAQLLSITNNQSDIIWISHHAGWINDAMGFPEIDSIASAFTQGAPMAAVDRVKFGSQGAVAVPVNSFQSSITSQLGQAAQVSVEVTGNYDPVTRFANIQVTANFPMSAMAQNEYRINLIAVEDSVIGSGNGYNQSNYFNNTMGHYYQGAGNPIMNYPHRHVARAVLSTAWGNSGIIPNAPMAATDYVANYIYQVPMGYDETKLRFVAFVTDFNAMNANDRMVLNANQEDLMNFGMTTNTRQVSFLNDVTVAPNPVKEVANLILNSNENQMIDIEVSNIKGQIVRTQQNVSLLEGENNIQLPVNDLSNGVYFITLRNGNALTSKKILVRN